MGEKDIKVSLFYLKHPANSNSRENSGILARFQCFLLNLNSSSAQSTTTETVETTTDQRNSSIIGGDKIHISSKKRGEMQFIMGWGYSRPLRRPGGGDRHKACGCSTA